MSLCDFKTTAPCSGASNVPEIETVGVLEMHGLKCRHSYSIGLTMRETLRITCFYDLAEIIALGVCHFDLVK